MKKLLSTAARGLVLIFAKVATIDNKMQPSKVEKLSNATIGRNVTNGKTQNATPT